MSEQFMKVRQTTEGILLIINFGDDEEPTNVLMTPRTATDLGETLFKAGWDTRAAMNAETPGSAD